MTAAAPARVLAVTRKPESASYQQRVLRYIAPLSQRGLFVSRATLPRDPLGQWRAVRGAARYDAVWWHRHLLSGWWVKRLRSAARRLVFDFDDPLIYDSRRGAVSATRRARFERFVASCDLAIAGSEYLAELAAPLGVPVAVLPMAIDLPGHVPSRAAGPVELLWLGSASTQPYLEAVRGPLEAVGRAHPEVTLRLVAHAPMRFDPLTVDFRPWSEDEQVLALNECHVGLCPMPDTPWTRGKCPFKVVQYMAHAMAWVGSAVGQNVVASGAGAEARGICPRNEAGWTDALLALIEDAEARRAMGQRGRMYAEAHHDRRGLADRLAGLLRPGR